MTGAISKFAAAIQTVQQDLPMRFGIGINWQEIRPKQIAEIRI
jgi:hypothetical protein